MMNYNDDGIRSSYRKIFISIMENFNLD